MKHLITFLICLSLIHSALAEPSAKQLELGMKLAHLLDYKTLYMSFENTCRNPKGTLFDPKKLFEANSQVFSGITPQSAYWPRIEAIYDRYRSNVCEVLSPRDVNEFVGAQLASQLSEADLKSAISFYSSNEGRRIQRANTNAVEAIRLRSEQALGGLSSPAYKEASKSLIEVTEQYRRAPK